MDDTEKRLERAEKHSDGKKKHGKEWEKENGIPLFYQLPKRGHGNHKPGSKRALEHREHALASGCNISRRRNATLDKMSAQNLNIIRKWSLSILKLMELTKKKLSMKKKRFVISLSPIKYLEEVLDF